MVREFAVEVEWVPFELHPETPAQGRTLPDEPADPSRREAGERLARLAQAAGLPWQRTRTVANAHKALEAAEWAREQGPGTFDRVHRALFGAYFGQGRNISTIDQVLGEVTSALADAGAPADLAGLRAALEGGDFSPRVDELTALARQNGIRGTPTFVFSDQLIVSGAQDFPVFVDVLTQLGVPRRAGVEPEEDGADLSVSLPEDAPLIVPDEIDGPPLDR